MLQPIMMHRPLLISDVIEHAAAQFGDVEIASRETHGPMFRYTYEQCAARARKLAHALKGLGLRAGNAVATLAWNNHRHLETYYGVSGSGMVIHTCNPRLHPEQLIYIVNHAEDSLMFFDRTFAPLVERIAPDCPKIRAFICLSDAADVPEVAGVDGVLCYEDWIAPHPEEFDWPQFDERTGAAICYTSGTTGHPKGALYSHRAIVLNALTSCLPGVLSLSPRDTILPAVPMFHVNGWCIPYAAPIGGAKLVLPGQRLDGASLYELMEAEGVTVSAGVPTIWLSLMNHLEHNGLRFSTLQRLLVGGSAMPIALIAKFADACGVEVRHGWGMTETVAVATMGCLSDRQLNLPADARHAVTAKHGKAVIGVKHPRWEERPLLFVVRKPEHHLEREEILAFLSEQIVKWWVPDEVIFLDSLPVGGTGKVQKAALRERYGSIFISGSA